MISLQELLDINYESVDLFSESPMRFSRWSPDQLNGLSGNYTFTIGLKEKAKYVGLFENKYEIYTYSISKETIDCFVEGDFTIAYFQYIITENNTIEMSRVWQDPLYSSLPNNIDKYYSNGVAGLKYRFVIEK